MPGPMLMQVKPVWGRSAMSRSTSSMSSPTFFGEWSLVREWGRIGTAGQGHRQGDMPTFALYVISNGSFAANETANAVTGGMKYSW